MRKLTVCVSAAILTAIGGAHVAGASEQLVIDTCGACHSPTDNGLSRIDGQRKTPEGWMMTIVRMQQSHGLNVSAEDRRAIVQFLSDTQGLAPAEAAPFRYALEKDPHAQEAPEEPMASMCARCHTEARVGLQRRTPEEWSIHMDFHVGNYPTIEYQALGRDREWFKIAKDEIAPFLAETYPLDTPEWSDWQAADKNAAGGDWIILADLPHAGEAYGRLTVSGNAAPYDVSGEMITADGTSLPVSGQMNLYTGYEWRATLDIGGEIYRQVVAMSEDGSRLDGRQFLRETDSLGGRLTGVRADQEGVILGTVPSAVPAGAAKVQVVGSGLGALDASAGDASANHYGAALALTTEGNGQVSFASGGSEGSIAHYSSVDSIVVEPAFSIARVGGGSDVGPEAVPVHFNAIGMWNGADGQPGTEDDIRIGQVNAEWRVDNLHDHAAHMKDASYAGDIGETGIFTPAVAGPNSERPFTTNNAGELKIVAEAMGQSADATLIVTVQRFIDPPIR
ncbi:quinohemoprotein amine dehydrogenase subunit alpha [Ruegeria sp. MALMAid1280]|uniref:quinohemoprotein amine dehydrogenase subunit alpha n=1 Tax=Ruegeria sp. MALMAid1280 TaxID=3411634 RepID=UPI003B9EDA0F